MVTPSTSSLLALLIALSVLAIDAQVPRAGTMPVPNAGSTGKLGGTVVLVGAQRRPLGRVVISVSSAELSVEQATVTDDVGRFVLEGLPAGRFRLTATKPGYLSAAFGAIGQTHPGADIVLAAGERLDDLNIGMSRAGAITGSVRDRLGQPMERIRVTAFRVRSDLPLKAVAPASDTDDRGVFRVFGLVPGDYIIAASSTALDSGGEIETPLESEIDHLLEVLAVRHRPGNAPANVKTPPLQEITRAQLSPVFFPGTLDSSGATRLTVKAGDTVAGVDIVWQEERSVSIDGALLSTFGAFQTVSLSISRVPSDLMVDAMPRATRPDSNGHFRFSGLGPGRYVIEASGRQKDEVSTLWARTELDVGSNDVAGVSLTLRPAFSVTGRIGFDGESPPIAELARMRVSLTEFGQGLNSGQAGLVPGRKLTAGLNADGSFSLAGVVPKRYTVDVAAPGWFFISGKTAHGNLLDGAVWIDEDSADSVLIALSKQPARIVGRLEVPPHQYASSYTVVIFPADAARRRVASRSLRTSTIGSNGTFTINGLPAGDYFVGIATAQDSDELLSPRFLGMLEPFAIRVTLRLHEEATITLKVPGT